MVKTTCTHPTIWRTSGRKTASDGGMICGVTSVSISDATSIGTHSGMTCGDGKICGTIKDLVYVWILCRTL